MEELKMEIELIEPSTELTVQDRAAVALNATKTEIALCDLAAKHKGIVAIVDKNGREQAHGAGMELKRARTSIDKLSKDVREDATKFSRAVIAEAARLTAIIEPEETRLLGLRDNWDAEQARIKAEAEAANRARIMAINQKIADIRGYVSLALECRGSDRIRALQDKLAAIEITEAEYQEFAPEAIEVRAAAGGRVEEILAAKLADEADRARIKAEQEAQALALAAERAAFEAERIAIANAQAVQNAHIAEEKRKLDAQRAEIEAKTAPVVTEDFESQVEAFAKAVKVEPVAAVQPVVKIGEPVSLEPTDTEIIQEVFLHLSMTYDWSNEQSAARLAAITNWSL